MDLSLFLGLNFRWQSSRWYRCSETLLFSGFIEEALRCGSMPTHIYSRGSETPLNMLLVGVSIEMKEPREVIPTQQQDEANQNHVTTIQMDPPNKSTIVVHLS